ncbi:hypothetical protein F7Q92_11705 [Ideonella dechloratans]|uniref:BIG2 domain-containing protein n=1 Tax=Ideonella dechloratans TaxID=36863 RepID=A0A643FCF8_IDEDE|nr:hypothetical protein [Ideonella dechloratans]KAB0581389.1 hypothetical protein F7Q92_11705 [Ideonella dechloratans]UFU12353.1 hypothetical protein LRM40_18350 [Ideonella dechloratans]
MFRIPRLFLATLLAAGLTACGGGLSGADLAQSQAITFNPAPTLTLGGTAQVGATASSGLVVSFSSLSSTVCSVSTDGLVTALALGDCVVAADQAGDASHRSAPQVTQTLSVQVSSPLAQTLSFDPSSSASSLRVGRSARVAASASSGLAVAYRSLTPAVCSVGAGDGLVQGLAVGDCVLAADQAGDDRYAAAAAVTWPVAVVSADALTVPGQPTGVSVTLGSTAQSVLVSAGSVDDGGSPITGYTIASVPSGITVTVASLPATVACGGSCAGHAFTVRADNAQGQGAVSGAAHILGDYNVVLTVYEPQTQPNNSIFTGRFTLDSTTRSVSGLSGSLSESMTDNPMRTVGLSHQLAALSDSTGTGLLVGSFALATTDTFVVAHGNAGWKPGPASDALYAGYPSAANPASGGTGNAYALIFVNPDDPTAALSAAQLQQTAYADCTALGMMGAICMTGTTVAAYGSVGSMGGYPVSQLITRR